MDHMRASQPMALDHVSNGLGWDNALTPATSAVDYGPARET